MENQLIFRVRGLTGTTEKVVMTTTNTFEDLFQEISKIFKMPTASFEVLHGFPPEIVSTDATETLDGNVTTNTVLILRSITTQLPQNGSNAPSKSMTAIKSHNVITNTKSCVGKPKSTSLSQQTSTCGFNVIANSRLKANPTVTTISRTGDIVTQQRSSARATRARTPSSKNRRSKGGVRQSVGSSEDIADHLISAVNGGAGKRSEVIICFHA